MVSETGHQGMMEGQNNTQLLAWVQINLAGMILASNLVGT